MQTVNRLTCLAQLSQVVKATVRNQEEVNEIAHDWKSMDYTSVARDVCHAANDERMIIYVKKCKILAVAYCRHFEKVSFLWTVKLSA